MTRLWKFFALVALIGPAVPAVGAIPLLHAHPANVPMALAAGKTQLTGHALVYVPKDVAKPAPLIVLLRGGATGADEFLEQFRSEADHRGAILVALEPAGSTWTLKDDGHGGADFGGDPAALDAALAALFARAPIDPARTVILGHSDGASYAISLGLSNPQLFRGIVALSPGMAWRPPTVDAKQRIFIAHGMRDTTLPFKNTRDTIVPGLEAAGLKVQTRWFNAGHDVDRLVVKQGLDDTLGAAQ